MNNNININKISINNFYNRQDNSQELYSLRSSPLNPRPGQQRVPDPDGLVDPHGLHQKELQFERAEPGSGPAEKVALTRTNLYDQRDPEDKNGDSKTSDSSGMLSRPSKPSHASRVIRNQLGVEHPEQVPEAADFESEAQREVLHAEPREAVQPR